jgi:perosamine synthetase
MIPVCEPTLGGNVLRYVQDCVETGWISSEGKYIREFEASWAAYCGAKHGIAVTNGTAALIAAMAVLRLPKGSEVILPSYTIISCATAIIDCGCVPVLVDADPKTMCLDVDQVAARITPKTRAIMPVHMFGHPADMGPLLELAQRHNLFIVEDAAEAHGARWKDRVVGGIGDLGCFSFYANKIVTTGEGGMVVTSNDQLAERLRAYRNLCFQPSRRFLHNEIGYNLRMTNIQAAIGLSQVEMIDELVAKKRLVAASYSRKLAGVKGIAIVPEEQPWAFGVNWMYSIILDDDVPFDAAEFAVRLKALGIDTRPLFLGMHEQPVFLERGLFAGESYPVTERLARRGLYLPSSASLGEAEIDQAVAAVKQVLS